MASSSNGSPHLEMTKEELQGLRVLDKKVKNLINFSSDMTQTMNKMKKSLADKMDDLDDSLNSQLDAVETDVKTLKNQSELSDLR